jgi:hypothetical protein
VIFNRTVTVVRDVRHRSILQRGVKWYFQITSINGIWKISIVRKRFGYEVYSYWKLIIMPEG